MKSINELFEEAIKMDGVKIAVAAAEDKHVLKAVVEAEAKGIADFILVGDEKEISSILEELGASKSNFEIRHEEEKMDACAKAVGLVVDGEASALMKGLVDTSVLMKAALNKENGLRTGERLSHLAAFEVERYHKLMFITDAAVNVNPDLMTKKSIIKNSVDSVRNLGISEPKVALLCAKEKVDSNMPITLEYKELVEMNESGEIENCKVAGPLSLDVAISKEAAQIKRLDNPVCGDADILVAPDIEAGNILYKSLSFLGHARNGGVVVGAKVPIIVTSRADSSDSKLIGIALAVLFGTNKNK